MSKGQILPALLALLVTLSVSCGNNGETPKSVSTETPDSSASVADLSHVTDETTMGDAFAILTPDEIDCVRDTLGSIAFDSMQHSPLAALVDGTVEVPLACLTKQNLVEIQLAGMTARAGGLGEDSRACLREVAVGNPAGLGIGAAAREDVSLAVTEIKRHICLTDEEAAALTTGSEEGTPPSPSVLRCMGENLGGMETLLEMFGGAEASTDEDRKADAAFRIFAAAQACE